MSSTAVVVRRGSHVHQVPQTGLPHSIPRTIASDVNRTPISADAAATRSHRVFLVFRYAMLAMKTTKNDRYASQAAGTWTYMIRCTSPWTASGGATTRESTTETPSATSVAIPSRCSPLRDVALPSARSAVAAISPPTGSRTPGRRPTGTRRRTRRAARATRAPRSSDPRPRDRSREPPRSGRARRAGARASGRSPRACGRTRPRRRTGSPPRRARSCPARTRPGPGTGSRPTGRTGRSRAGAPRSPARAARPSRRTPCRGTRPPCRSVRAGGPRGPRPRTRSGTRASRPSRRRRAPPSTAGPAPRVRARRGRARTRTRTRRGRWRRTGATSRARVAHGPRSGDPCARSPSPGAGTSRAGLHGAVAQRDDARGEAGCHGVVGGDHERPSLVGRMQHHLVDRAPGRVVQPGRPLVAQQELGIADDRACDRDLLTHPGGERSDAFVGDIGEGHAFERPLHEVMVDVEQVGEQLEVLARGQLLVQTGAMGKQLGAPADLLALVGEVEPEHRASPVGRGQRRGDDPEQGALARAVRSAQDDGLPPLDREVDAHERRRGAEQPGDPTQIHRGVLQTDG